MQAFRLPGGGGLTIQLRLIIALCCAAVLSSSIAGATTQISQGYTTSSNVSIGSIVSLKEGTKDEVIPSTSKSADNIFGVAINSDSSLLTVSNSNKSQIQVATSGTVPVLVSDINGAIKQGDHITASPLAGVGMKATANVRIIGIAQGAMKNTKKQTYKDAAGKEQSVTLGEAPVLINVSYYFKEPEKTIVPGALQNVANALAGKNVSTLPIVLACAVFFIMLIVVSSIIYSMIRSSIISIGRNPMSQSAVYRDMIQMSGLVIGILTAGTIAIYLILTRL